MLSKGFKWPGEVMDAISILMMTKHRNERLIPRHVIRGYLKYKSSREVIQGIRPEYGEPPSYGVVANVSW